MGGSMIDLMTGPQFVLIILFGLVVLAIMRTRAKIQDVDDHHAHLAHRGDSGVFPVVKPRPQPSIEALFANTPEISQRDDNIAIKMSTERPTGKNLGVRLDTGVGRWYDSKSMRQAYRIEDCSAYRGCSVDRSQAGWISTISPDLNIAAQRYPQEFLFPFIISEPDKVTISFGLRTSASNVRVWVNNEATQEPIEMLVQETLKQSSAPDFGSAADLHPRLSSKLFSLDAGPYTLRVRVENKSRNSTVPLSSLMHLKGTLATTIPRNIRTS